MPSDDERERNRIRWTNFVTTVTNTNMPVTITSVPWITFTTPDEGAMPTPRLHDPFRDLIERAERAEAATAVRPLTVGDRVEIIGPTAGAYESIASPPEAIGHIGTIIEITDSGLRNPRVPHVRVHIGVRGAAGRESGWNYPIANLRRIEAEELDAPTPGLDAPVQATPRRRVAGESPEPVMHRDSRGNPIWVGNLVQIVGPADDQLFQRFSANSASYLGMHGVVTRCDRTASWANRLGIEMPFVEVEMSGGVTRHILCRNVLVIIPAIRTPASAGEIAQLRHLMATHNIPEDVLMSVNQMLDSGALRHDEYQTWESHLASFPRRAARSDVLSPQFTKEVQKSLIAEFKDVPSGKYALPGIALEVTRPTVGPSAGTLLFFKIKGSNRYPSSSVDEVRKLLKIILTNPKRYIRQFGKSFGVCGLCNRPLEHFQHTIGIHYLCMDKQKWELEENE